MSKDVSQTKWHGIPRAEIPWFPTVDAQKCIGCELCFVTCGREVYEIVAGPPRKARVERPYNCMVACSTCAVVCPTGAISFPPRELILKLEIEHKILDTVRKEAAEKRARLQAARVREQAEEQLRKMHFPNIPRLSPDS